MDVLTLSLTVKKALKELGVDDNTHTIKWTYRENTEGLVVVGGALIKVSSLTPSIEELEGGTVSISGAVNEKVTLTAYGETRTLADIGGAIIATDLTIIVYSDNFVFDGLAFPEKGIYIPNIEGQTIELSYGSIHPIDPKYLHTVIDLDEYGFDLANFVMGGGGIKPVKETAKMWEIINKSKNVVFTCKMNGVPFTLVPCAYSSHPDNGNLVSVGFSLVTALNSNMVHSNIVIASAIVTETGEYADFSSLAATITTTPLE